jgi:glycosyltransferase involved in cell wall biosynthesis
LPPRPRVALVFTRAAEDDVGREKTMRAIREALASCGAVQPFRLHSVAETGKAGDILHAFAVWFWSLICLHPMALQCALFATRSDCQALVDAIKAGGFDAVYIDMVRSQYFLRCLRRAMPQIRIITDLDDLISRRMRFAAMLRLPLSLGFAGRFLTPWLRRLVEGMLPARLVYRYEEQGTAGAEFEMAMASQATVLVSEVERDLLAARLPQAKKGEVHAIIPPAPLRRDASPRTEPVRFIFVGSDSYQPNRLAIDFLLALWRKTKPLAPLHIFGRQKRTPVAVPGVVWHGFVHDLAEAYTAGSIALMPCFVPGGIKTKIVEAWSFGCPVLGNPEAFEGLTDPGYPLALPLGQWGAWLAAPEPSQADAAAKAGQNEVMSRMSPDRFQRAWCALI